MLDVMDNFPGNASALHSSGHAAKNLIEEDRKSFAKLIGAKPHEIIFTSGGSESNNTVMHIFEGKPISISPIEHDSVFKSAQYYASKLNGENPALTSVMLANNELGTISNVREIAARSHNSGSLFHSDMTQALGKIPINVKELDVDYATFSGHKIGAPVGVGVLYVKTGAPFKPLILGGHQENGRRAGTYNTLAIAALGTAAKYVYEHKTWEIYEKSIRPLRDELKTRILAEIPGSSINSPEDCLPNILNMSFSAAEGESIQLYLDLEGNIEVSTGSACASGSLEPSRILMATYGDAERAHNSIRFSLGLNTTKSDIDKVMATLPAIIKRLQGMSTREVKND